MSTVFKRGGVWWLRCRIDGRQVRESLRTTNRKVAETLRVRREFELRQQADGAQRVAVLEAQPEAAKPVGTLAEIRAEYEQWSCARKRAHTIRNDRGRLDAFFGSLPGAELAEITTRDVERYLTQQALKGRAPATILRNREILHAFWRWAVRQGYATSNVVADIPRPRLPEHDPRFLSLDQIDELLAAVAGDVIAPIVATAVFAGLRREELCWLTAADLDLEREPAILRVRAKTIGGESWQSKTKRDRKVPVSSRLRTVLEAHREATGKRGAPWLFPSPDGVRWDRDNLSRQLRAALGRAQLPWNFLDLRHTFGSQLARKGVSLLKIAKLMGNSPAIASRHYINLVPEEMGDEVEF